MYHAHIMAITKIIKQKQIESYLNFKEPKAHTNYTKRGKITVTRQNGSQNDKCLREDMLNNMHQIKQLHLDTSILLARLLHHHMHSSVLIDRIG